MGIPAQFCLGDFGTPPVGDQANGVVSGQFIAPGVSSYFSFFGYTNFNLTSVAPNVVTTNYQTFDIQVTGPTIASLSNGCSIGFIYNISIEDPSTSTFPPGGVLTGYNPGTGAGIISFPPTFITAKVNTGSSIIKGNFPTNGFNDGVNNPNIIDSFVTGPPFPNGANIISIIVPSNQMFGFNTPHPNIAIVEVDTPAITMPNPPAFQKLTLTLEPNIMAGTSTNAFFTGSTIKYNGSVQLEKSYDGGNTWYIANIGPPGSGALAIFQDASSVSFSLYEPEQGVLYRWNCTSFTPFTTGSDFIQYRISSTGVANQTYASL